MASRKNVEPQFVDTSVDDDDEVVIDEPVTVMSGDSNIVTAKVKGTWVMYWGRDKFDFVDGKRYKLPKDLFQYLRKSGNIYDTL
jgi:hypothetical protein